MSAAAAWDEPDSLEPNSFVPKVGSSAYTKKGYWEYRFARESVNFEWLCRYEAFAEHVRRLIPRASRVLVVGCGNSNLSTDLARDGYTTVVSTDYSEECVTRMRSQTCDEFPGIQWMVADMTDLEAVFEAGSFDAIIDKAAMDALLADGGDTWDPPAQLLQLSGRVMEQYAKVLRPDGVLLQVSFSQPHFRKLYLAPQAAAGGQTDAALPAPDFTQPVVHKIDVGFGYFMFELIKI